MNGCRDLVCIDVVTLSLVCLDVVTLTLVGMDAMTLRAMQIVEIALRPIFQTLPSYLCRQNFSFHLPLSYYQGVTLELRWGVGGADVNLSR